MVGIEIKEIQTTNFVIYRPPDTKKEEFKVILEDLRNILKDIDNRKTIIIVTGDFNFRFVEWSKNQSGACSYKYKQGVTRDEKDQFLDLLNICNEYCLSQIIEEPTRGENTLDLFFTNEVNLINEIEINKSSMSDHSRIELSTNYILNEEQKSRKEMEDPNTKLRSFNFRADKKIDWIAIKENIRRIHWKEMLKGDTEEITEELLNKISKLSRENIPKKKKEGKDRKVPREIKKILNRIKMLKRAKHKTKSKEREKAIEIKIVETEKELLESRRKKKLESEKKAIECMKDNPKMFYSLINKQKNTKN